jgi:transposase
MEARLVERARIVLGCLEGKPVGVVAGSLQVRPNTVIDWRRRFEKEGLAGLRDRSRSGKPPLFVKCGTPVTRRSQADLIGFPLL